MQRMEQSKTLGPKYFKQTLSKSYQIVSWREEPGKKESLTPILFYFCSDRNCCSVAKLYPTLWPHWLQHARPPCPSPTPRVYSNPCPLSPWCHPNISSSAVPFSSCLSLSQHQGLFQWVGSSHQVAKVLELQRQHQSFQWIFRSDFL